MTPLSIEQMLDAYFSKHFSPSTALPDAYAWFLNGPSPKERVEPVSHSGPAGPPTHQRPGMEASQHSRQTCSPLCHQLAGQSSFDLGLLI